jgi:hypothetical protein
MLQEVAVEIIPSFVMALIGITVIAGAIQGSMLFLGDLGDGTIGLLGRAILFFGGICIAAPDRFAGFSIAELTIAGVIAFGIGFALAKVGAKKSLSACLARGSG